MLVGEVKGKHLCVASCLRKGYLSAKKQIEHGLEDFLLETFIILDISCRVRYPGLLTFSL